MVSAGRRAVVTGGASGIGRAVAERLRKAGAEGLAVDGDAERLKPVEAAGGEIYIADLADLVQRERFAGNVRDFDYLVNAADVLHVKPILGATVVDWRMIQTVNAESVFFICQRIGARLDPGGVAPKRGIAASELDAQRKKVVPLNRGARADECDGLICYLLSDAAAYLTGQAINFTGSMVNW